MTTTTATQTPAKFELVCVGPMSTGASVRVHVATCRNAKRDARQSGHGSDLAAHSESHTSMESLVTDWYGDIMAEYEDETWENYTGEVHVCACVPANFPYRDGEVVDLVAKPKGATPAQNGRDARSTVGVWPTTSALLAWSEDCTTTGQKFSYRYIAARGGGKLEMRTTVRGKWTGVAGTCTMAQAQILAGYIENGATWLTYRKVAGLPFGKLGVPGTAE